MLSRCPVVSSLTKTEDERAGSARRAAAELEREKREDGRRPKKLFSREVGFVCQFSTPRPATKSFPLARCSAMETGARLGVRQAESSIALSNQETHKDAGRHLEG